MRAVGPHHQAVCCLGTPAGSDLEELSGACSGSGYSEACSKSGQGGDGPKDQPTPVQATSVAIVRFWGTLVKKVVDKRGTNLNWSRIQAGW